jgi:hypothetical protein
MRRAIKLLATILAGALLTSQPGGGQATPPSADLEAHLTLISKSLREGEHCKVRVEIQNIGNHVVLVGRDLNLVSNMPFRMEIRLEDSAGRQFIPYGGAAVDFLQLPDLQLENGLLKWRVPLYPHTFLGTYFKLNLNGIPPGKYTLHGKYILGRPPHEETDLERALVASHVSVFQGAVETNSIQVEVLPKN